MLSLHITYKNNTQYNYSSFNAIQNYDMIIVLHCYNNNLNNLPKLPKQIRELYCGFNRLNELPELPNSLKKFGVIIIY